MPSAYPATRSYHYQILAHIHSDKGQCFENDILFLLYSMYNMKQSITTPYNSCGNSICEQFNHTMLDLMKTMPKEQKANWHLHPPSVVFGYNAMPHSITGYQPYELMSRHRAPDTCDAWLGLANYNDRTSTSKCAWINKQHELLMRPIGKH